METLVSEDNLQKLVTLWKEIKTDDKSCDISSVSKMGQSFAAIKTNNKLLSNFFTHCNIAKHFYGNELQQLYDVSMKMTSANNWSELALKEVLTWDWKLFGTWKGLFSAFEKIQSSDINLSMWRTEISRCEALWTVRLLADMDTYEFCQWVRANAKAIVRDLHRFDFEKFVHNILSCEIDGQKAENFKENELLSALYPSGSVDDNHKTAIANLYKAIQTRKEDLSRIVRENPPTKRQFNFEGLKQILQKVRENWIAMRVKLQERKITGLEIKNSFELLRHKSAEDIFKQIQSYYKDVSADLIRVALSESEQRDMDDIRLSMPNTCEPQINEFKAFGALMSQHSQQLPNLSNTNRRLTGKILLEQIKKEIARTVQDYEDGATSTAMNWSNIIHACDIPSNLENWIKFVTYHVFLKNDRNPVQKDEMYRQIAQDLNHVFECFNCEEALKLLRDVTTAFNWEDEEWKDLGGLLKTLENETMRSILRFWNENKLSFGSNKPNKKKKESIYGCVHVCACV
ncbi:hypothetical protein RFI_18942 [Reticulomyxa filosa]|uniref:Uncharacterized protein n=1 Tax=Reticulomyxa filosa TaxID=46433 RepID=X6MXI5_RETFI|nr:hypothetical protein RFI_18942 [Reticulomyxa filosa]|eukprot:ETO18331.1 hypothetical protein RFI_18942 [Reticulomyxa filosa]